MTTSKSALRMPSMLSGVFNAMSTCFDTNAAACAGPDRHATNSMSVPRSERNPCETMTSAYIWVNDGAAHTRIRSTSGGPITIGSGAASAAVVGSASSMSSAASSSAAGAGAGAASSSAAGAGAGAASSSAGAGASSAAGAGDGSGAEASSSSPAHAAASSENASRTPTSPNSRERALMSFPSTSSPDPLAERV